MNWAMPHVPRVFIVALAFVGWLWSGWALLAGLLWGAALRCDEACDGQGWRRSPDAWQWNGIVVLGVVAFIAGTALVIFVWRRRRAYAAAALVIELGAVLVLGTALSPEWLEHLDRRSAGELAAMLAGIAAPIVAVVLANSSARHATPRSQRPTESP
jgi:hypothetical protein